MGIIEKLSIGDVLHIANSIYKVTKQVVDPKTRKALLDQYYIAFVSFDEELTKAFPTSLLEPLTKREPFIIKLPIRLYNLKSIKHEN